MLELRMDDASSSAEAPWRRQSSRGNANGVSQGGMLQVVRKGWSMLAASR